MPPAPPDPTLMACRLISKFEGCRLSAYLDQGGVATIGYGCTGPGIRLGIAWTQAQASAELLRRVGGIEHVLSAMLDVPVNCNQSAALVSLCYNIGLKAFENSTLRRILNQRNYVAAAEQFPAWNHVGGQPNSGLTNRRRTERALFLKPIASTLGTKVP